MFFAILQERVKKMEIHRHTHRLPDYFTHVHAEAYEIMYCIEGGYEFHFGAGLLGGENHNVRIKPKTMILLPPGVPHGTSLVQYPYDRYFIQFDENMMSRFLDDSTVKSAFFAYDSEDEEEKTPQVCIWDVSESADRLEALMSAMHDLRFTPNMEEPWRELNLISLFGLFWCEVYRNHKNFFVRSLAQYTRPIRKIKNFIDHHYDQPITIDMLADQCYLSPGYLSKTFRSQVGMSPRQYLTSKRLEEARKLLCSTQCSIQEISMRTGFGDVNYFIQQFKTHYGQTPKQYQQLEARRLEM